MKKTPIILLVTLFIQTSLLFSIDKNRLSQLADETLKAKDEREIITLLETPELKQLRSELEETQILFWNQNNIEDVKKTYPDLLFFVNSLKSKCNNSDQLFRLLLSLGLIYAYLYTLSDLTPLQKRIDKETSILIDHGITLALSSKDVFIDGSKISNYNKTVENKINYLFPNNNADKNNPNFILLCQFMVLKGTNFPGIFKKYNIPSNSTNFHQVFIPYFIFPAIDILNL